MWSVPYCKKNLVRNAEKEVNVILEFLNQLKESKPQKESLAAAFDLLDTNNTKEFTKVTGLLLENWVAMI